jgi:hypothetical protein
MVDETNSNELISASATLEENSAINVSAGLGEVGNSDSLDSKIEESAPAPDEVVSEHVNGLTETSIENIVSSKETIVEIDSEIDDSVDSPAEMSEEAVPETAEESPEVEANESRIEEASQEKGNADALTVEDVPKKEPRTEAEILELVSKLVLEIDAISVSTLSADSDMEAAGDLLEEKTKLHEDFQDWYERRKGSYAWKLLNILKVYRSDLEKDEKELRDFAASESALKEGFGEATRKWFMKRFWMNFSISWVALFILYLVNRFSDQISTFLANAFGGHSFLKQGLDFALRSALGLTLRQVIGSIFGISFLHFFGLLFAYSRRNSEHSQLVAEESAAATAMENGIEAVRNARERIDSLHPQVPQVIEVLSLGLHNPWKIDNGSLLFTGSVPDTSILPASVEVAVPTIVKKSPKYEELVLLTMNKIQIPGWRDLAFKKVVQELAESVGFGANDMAVRELDEDQRKSGKRQLLIAAGKDPAPTEKIGIEQVDIFTKVTQEEVLPKSQPQIVSLRPNPLDGLELDGSIGFNIQDGVSKWEVYLSEIADLASPWSTSTFSSKGQAQSKHINVESIFISSEQVNRLTKPGVVGEVAVKPGARPFEVAIRVDFSEWCKPDEVAIFSDFTATSEQIERWSRGGSTHGVTIHSDEQDQDAPIAPDGLVL